MSKIAEFIAHTHAQGNVQTVRAHCLHTAFLASEALRGIGLSHTAYLAGVLHDCGKAHPDFYRYITDAHNGKPVHPGKIIHSFAGVGYVLQHFHASDDLIQNITAELIAYAVGAHHGLFDLFDSRQNNGFQHRLTAQPDYDETAVRNFLNDVIIEEDLQAMFDTAVSEVRTIFGKLQKTAAGPEELYFYLGMLARLLAAAVMDGDRRDTAEFMTQTIPEPFAVCPRFWESYAQKIKDVLRQFPCETPVQKARSELSLLCEQAAQDPEGLYRLNIPTGGGKTLSGLRYALSHAAKHNKKRIFYLAPLISILEQNAEVIRNAVSDKIVLEHHSDVLTTEDGEDELRNRSFLEETWDAPIIVTTLVQFLNTLFAGKTTSVRRMCALCDSVLLIDEVQSVPTKMLSLFNMAINFLCTVCKCTVLLCSATQPALEELPHKLCPVKPIISDALYARYNEVFKRNTLLYAGGYRLEDIPAFAEQTANKYSSVLVICNKKSEAAFLFDALHGSFENCFHLSAGMCISHRKDTMRSIYAALNTGQRTICVSTQVIEAGVDISFACVIRLSAGMDSIVQSAGRCNRNGEADKLPPVYILNCMDEKLTKLEDISNGKKATTHLLAAYDRDPSVFENDLSSPSAIEFYYKQLYRHTGFAQNHYDYPLKTPPSILEMLADNTLWCDRTYSGQYVLRQAFRTAGQSFEVFDENTTAVLVPYADGAEQIERLMDLYEQADYDALKKQTQQIKPYSVSVYNYERNKLLEEHAIYPICDGLFYVLDESFYNPETGIITKKEGTICSTLIL